MTERPVVLCAVDLGPQTRRVLVHAAGMARLMSAELRVVHVAGDASSAQHESVMTECLMQVPYEVALEAHQVVVRTGRVSDVIHREARRHRTVLLVIGSRGRGGLARRMLGSTSAAVLKNAGVPVLLVPSTDLDIISVGDHMRLSCGPVLAAVDLGAACEEQLQIAGNMAVLAGQPLRLFTVAKSGTTDHAASRELRDRAHVAAVKPDALIVRRGGVPAAIADCARTEGSGLVVMGVSSGQRGLIAAAVLRTGRAFVLAVPGDPVRPPQTAALPRAVAPLASLTLALTLTAGGAAQVRFNDTDAIVHFQRTVDGYAFLHRQVERRLGMAHHAPPGSDAMAIAMREARPGAMPGQLLTPDVVPVIRLALTRAARAADCGPPRVSGSAAHVHDSADRTEPLPPCLLDALPRLPAELEFRWSGDALVLVDTHAGLVVDLISGLFGTTVFQELDDHRQQRDDHDSYGDEREVVLDDRHVAEEVPGAGADGDP
jgi:nucleotide-binding universal stress UspA family protein